LRSLRLERSGRLENKRAAKKIKAEPQRRKERKGSYTFYIGVADEKRTLGPRL